MLRMVRFGYACREIYLFYGNYRQEDISQGHEFGTTPPEFVKTLERVFKVIEINLTLRRLDQSPETPHDMGCQCKLVDLLVHAIQNLGLGNPSTAIATILVRLPGMRLLVLSCTVALLLLDRHH